MSDVNEQFNDFKPGNVEEFTELLVNISMSHAAPRPPMRRSGLRADPALQDLLTRRRLTLDAEERRSLSIAIFSRRKQLLHC